MSKVLDLYQSLDLESQQYTEFVQNLLTVSSDLPFDTDEVNTLENSIISAINSKLNQAITRHEGLKILLDILPRCSNEVLSKYAVLWIAKAIQVLETSQSRPKDLDMASKVLTHLVVACKEIPDLQKQISMQNVKQLVTLISNIDAAQRTGGMFYVLAIILHHYREPCERISATINKLIIPLIDSQQNNLVQAGANCFALLAKASERSFKPSARFPDYTCAAYNQALICNTLHSIMDELFTGILELDSVDIWGKLELPEISQENIIEYYCEVERRFQNLCVYLSTILHGFAGKNSVSPNAIIKLVCRGLAVAPENLRSDDTFKKQMLQLILPKIQINLLNVLNAFINNFRRELAPFALTILQLYRQALKWTDKVDQSTITTLSGSRPFKNIRIAVYRSLTLWLNCLGSLSGADMIVDDILPFIVKDITPGKEQVLLTIQKTQDMSKKALKKFKNSQYENSTALGSASKIENNFLVNAELCKEALIVLQNIFYNSGVLLEPVTYRSLQKLIIPLLLDIYLERGEESFYTKDSQCRLNLLNILKAIQMNPNPLTPSPTQYSIKIFHLALNDSDQIIINEAKVALAELEKVIHPSTATLDLPAPQSYADDQNVHNETLSKKNESATDRIKNLVKEINAKTNGDAHFQGEEQSDDEDENEDSQMSGLNINGKADTEEDTNAEEVQGDLKDDDIEVIESNSEPPAKKQRKIQIVEEIFIPRSEGNLQCPRKAPSIEEISKESPVSSQESYGSNQGENAYFTIKDVQKMPVPKNTNPDQSIEIIHEINVSDEIRIIESEPKPSKDENGSDDEIILSMFCDQVRDD